MHVLTLLRRCARNQVVEYVEVALAGWGTSHTTAFQVVVESLHTRDASTLRELQLSVLAEMGRIGVEESARVAERFKDKLCRRDLLAKLRALLSRLAYAQLEESLDSQAAILRLSATRLTTKEPDVSDLMYAPTGLWRSVL